MKVIDFHAHAFPDAVAERAMPVLEKEGNIRAALDGKVASLLVSMERAGIERAVLASIATKPDQFGGILRWSTAMASERLTPFPSVHPAAPDAVAQVRMIHQAGFKGVKMHPYYQDFDLDEERLFPIYAEMERLGLLFLCHTGFDMAYPRVRKCDPEKIVRVIERFPRLKFITTHLGAWEDWDAVRDLLLGRPVYMDTCFSIEPMGPRGARKFLMSHPADYLLFGSDSPWADQAESLRNMRALDLPPELEAKLLHDNAQRLLEQAGT